tara:strand:- start:4488 stop:5711 length:1224 start_codon:yes stop_codon:yes gene_type:complete
MKNWVEKISLENVSVILFGLFPLLPNEWKPIPIVFLGLSTINGAVQRKRNTPRGIREYYWFLILPVVFILFVILGVKGDFNDQSVGKIETLIPLFLIPILIQLTPSFVTHKRIQLFSKTFIISLILFLLVFILHALVYTNPRYESSLTHVDFMRDSVNNIPFINTHPIYASIMLGLGVILSSGNLAFERNKWRIISIIAFTVGLLLLTSKMVLVSLIFLGLIYMIQHLFTYNRKSIGLLLISIFISVGLFYVYSSNNHRIEEVFQTKTYEKVHPSNSTSIRVGILKCVSKLILDEPILGYGFNGSQLELDQCYKASDSILFKGHYNSHNQYLGFWLYGGVLLFGIGVFMLMLPIGMAIYRKNKYLLFISVFYGVNMLTENILERQTGVILFSFILCFFTLTERRVIS